MNGDEQSQGRKCNSFHFSQKMLLQDPEARFKILLENHSCIRNYFVGQRRNFTVQTSTFDTKYSQKPNSYKYILKQEFYGYHSSVCLTTARRFSTKSQSTLLLRESPHTINVRDGDADVIRVLLKHINLEHAGLLDNICRFICIWIGVRHKFQQDLLTKVER